MVIILLERVPTGLRGELSRWMIEPKTNVFVGKISAMVRDKLWEKACKGARDGAAMLIYSSTAEQGFTVRTHGDTNRTLVDMEGLTLVHIPHTTRERTAEDQPTGLEGQHPGDSGIEAPAQPPS